MKKMYTFGLASLAVFGIFTAEAQIYTPGGDTETSLSSGGEIGVGTDTPTAKLHIKSPTNTLLFLETACMPTAAQMAEEWAAMGETERLLTIKIEELTLYLLQMSSRLRSMTDQYDTVMEEMEALREEITTLKGEK